MLIVLMMIIPMLIISVPFLYEVTRQRLGKSKARELSTLTRPKVKHSHMGEDIINAYNSLPADNRPGVDIEATVAALDVLHGIIKVDVHFRYIERYGYNTKYTWTCRCVGHVSERDYLSSSHEYIKECKSFESYRGLRAQIRGIEEELKTREQALRVAGVQHDLDQLEFVTETLRAERMALRDANETIFGG